MVRTRRHTPKTNVTTHLLYQYYGQYDNRLRSYDMGPQKLRPLAYKLAIAGLYYTGRTDIVQCFECHIRHMDWNSNDDPIQTHKQANPTCQYILQWQQTQVRLHHFALNDEATSMMTLGQKLFLTTARFTHYKHLPLSGQRDNLIDQGHNIIWMNCLHEEIKQSYVTVYKRSLQVHKGQLKLHWFKVAPFDSAFQWYRRCTTMKLWHDNKGKPILENIEETQQQWLQLSNKQRRTYFRLQRLDRKRYRIRTIETHLNKHAINIGLLGGINGNIIVSPMNENLKLTPVSEFFTTLISTMSMKILHAS
ncbi:uncharacterized protein LOC119082886 [Bradysia coprophila]|uniref:uncharacterized protein LOC119082886 n=1 Tax=Bradysia coprophila TaxID=38358 RepID=UPI00187DD23D|nr:uncharacterized protein LOC119082886 [Bradysia coprophila]